MRANEHQPGGSHYKAEYQHWDFAIDIAMPALEYAATKYLARFDKKGTPQLDLQKTRHYLVKMLENLTAVKMARLQFDKRWIASCFDKFIRSNGIDGYGQKYAALRGIVFWETEIDLRRALEMVDVIIKRVEEEENHARSIQPSSPVPLEDSNKHALQQSHDEPEGSAFSA